MQKFVIAGEVLTEKRAANREQLTSATDIWRCTSNDILDESTLSVF